MYEDSNVAFLLDPMDSVQVYEEAGKASQTESQYERGMKALASLGHVQQLTAIEGEETTKIDVIMPDSLLGDNFF